MNGATRRRRAHVLFAACGAGGPSCFSKGLAVIRVQVAVCRSAVRPLLLLLLLAPSPAQIEPPGKLTNIYTKGPVSFRYPQNWRILEQKSDGDFLIGPPDALVRWVEDDVHKKRKVEQTLVSHGMLCGYYEPNLPTPEGAADELLGRFRQHYGSLTYFGSDTKIKAGGRPALMREVSIREERWDTSGTRRVHQGGAWPITIEFKGVLFLIQDGERAWYWVYFTPPRDWQQYAPTMVAVLASITLDGVSINVEVPSEPHPGPEITESHTVAELTSGEIAKMGLRSTVVLTMQDSKGRPLKLATGFLVSKGVIATNFHVIEGAQQGYVSLVGDSRTYRVSGTVAVDREQDLALLAADEIDAPSLQLDASAPIDVGETVYVIGNPEGLEGTFSQGIVSSVRQGKDSELIQFTAPISHGSSGGPVLNRKGRVIGLAMGTLKEGQNLNFAIPAARVAELLTNAGPITPLAGPPRKAASPH